MKDDKAILTITAVERSDTGPYTLKLRNPEGTAEGKFNVTVECKFIILIVSLLPLQLLHVVYD